MCQAKRQHVLEYVMLLPSVVLHIRRYAIEFYHNAAGHIAIWKFALNNVQPFTADIVNAVYLPTGRTLYDTAFQCLDFRLMAVLMGMLEVNGGDGSNQIPFGFAVHENDTFWN